MNKKRRMKDFIKVVFDYLEIDRGIFLAGLIGSAISLTSEKKISLRRAIVQIITGALVAGYVTPLLSPYIDNPKLLNSMAFLVGLISMQLIEGVINLADKFEVDPLAFFRKFTKK